ncbi:MAG: hypothetical protein ACI9EF_000351 [Pseudohongiellaceae bacterium]|jgi:hypothetical protein
MKTSFFPTRLLLAGCAVVLTFTSACESVGSPAPASKLGQEAQAGPAVVAEPSFVEPVSEVLDLSGWTVSSGASGFYDLAWRSVDGTVPRNEVFDMDVLLLRNGQSLTGPQVRVRGWMPDHSHGLVRTPLVTNLGDGRHRVEGVLLHMRGLWQLMFDVTDGQQTDCVTFELSL